MTNHPNRSLRRQYADRLASERKAGRSIVFRLEAAADPLTPIQTTLADLNAIAATTRHHVLTLIFLSGYSRARRAEAAAALRALDRGEEVGGVMGLVSATRP